MFGLQPIYSFPMENEYERWQPNNGGKEFRSPSIVFLYGSRRSDFAGYILR